MLPKIYLASQSPRRKQLLEWAEIDFEILIQPTDETFPDALSPAEAVVHIAQQKALAVKDKLTNDDIVIAADTVVVLNDIIIGKPKDKEDAIAILTALSGNTHYVITGVVITRGEQQVTFYDTTTVEFHILTPQQIEFYIDKYEPYDKAGAYAIQEWIGVIGIKSINGDFYNVMGLPVSKVVPAVISLM